MRLVISKDRVKREIEGPFSVCASREDLHCLGRELIAIAAKMEAEGTTYGWQRIDTSHPDSCGPNTPPLPWTGQRNVECPDCGLNFPETASIDCTSVGCPMRKSVPAGQRPGGGS